MATYYQLLEIASDADQAAIDTAYARQRQQYDPERVRDLDEELQQIAAQRTAEIDRAYQVLRDPQRRRQYDIGIGLIPVQSAAMKAAQRRQINPRERMLAIMGAIGAVVLIGVIWVFTGREPGPTGAAMAEVLRPAPTFELPALAGGMVDLEQYRGQVVVLNFWATWCEPCKRELPALQAAHQRYSDQGLAIIGVNLADDEASNGTTIDDIRTFLSGYGVTYAVALDVEGVVTDDYRVFPLPTSFFIDGEGNIRYVHVGELTLEDVSARFAELQAASAAR
ncbi:MAG: redoxin domain-containing protein [Oscillochloris sp.]|nr:redoxin domain-containing protein [Oscillochloris sp.]